MLQCDAMSIINITIFIRKFSPRSNLLVTLCLGLAAIYEEQKGSLEVKKALFIFYPVDFTLIFKGRVSQNMWLGIISSPVAPLSFNTIIPPKKYKRKQMNRTNKIIPNAPIVLAKASLSFAELLLSEIVLFSLADF